MVLLTMISRVQDGLLLAASMQETEQSNRNFQEYHNQAKQLFRKLGDHSPNRCSLEAGAMTFHCLDIYIQKLKKSYLDTWSKRHLSSINLELQDVQKIMVTNIEEVLQRGEALSALDTKASNLSTLSKKYRQDAKFLNSRSAYAKAAATSLIFVVLMLYLRFWWLV
nr:vesicle-trafficking protein SEC22b-like [Pogona vitticeps]